MFLSKFFKIHVTNDSTRIAELPREQGYMPVVTWAALQFHIKVTFLNWGISVREKATHMFIWYIFWILPQRHQRPPCSKVCWHSSIFAVPRSTCGSLPKESSRAATLPCLSLLTTLWACCRRSRSRCGSRRTAGTWSRGHHGPWAPGNQERKSKSHNLMQEIREKQEKQSALLIHKLQNARVASVIIRPLNPVCQVQFTASWDQRRCFPPSMKWCCIA